MDCRRQGLRPPNMGGMEPSSPSIMQSLDSVSLMEQSNMHERLWDPRPDLTLHSKFMDMNFDEAMENTQRSFLLVNNEEHLQVSSSEDFAHKLNMAADVRVKVVSIVGNTGDGKSHTLNHTFFNGHEVFSTSSVALCATMGVWAAYDPVFKTIVLDSEGLMGSTVNENQRTRLLLKMLAVSDVVIYRTRAERLHGDLFTFLGSASRAFKYHFQSALQLLGSSSHSTAQPSSIGPALIIFHETKYTKPLSHSLPNGGPEDYLQKRFSEIGLDIDAFSLVRYIGTQTESRATDFSELRCAVQAQLDNMSIRSPRRPHLVFTTLKALNERFNDNVHSTPLLFPDQYFTCSEECLSCRKRCESSMGHLKESVPHISSATCVYQNQYENYIYLCKKCEGKGVSQVVTPQSVGDSSAAGWYGLVQYVWSGYTIECPVHGKLYSSRSYWYGKEPPEDCVAVRTVASHVWPGTVAAAASAHIESNTAQKVLDGVTLLSGAVAGVVAQPTKMIGSYVADQIAPKYWRPNHEITHCAGCKVVFAASAVAIKHHCRNCGEGFCEECSSNSAPVPHHGWHDPVRVCDACYSAIARNVVRPPDGAGFSEPTDVRARRYGEILAQTVSSVATVIDYSKGLIKERARPSYWVPDSEVEGCCVCDVRFDTKVLLHHCRDCGRGVCDICSETRRPVPHRGWLHPVRVCHLCCKTE